ncbi:MAG: trypsin-like peptidase domain-containing protein [Actinomycetota bacterium]
MPYGQGGNWAGADAGMPPPPGPEPSGSWPPVPPDAGRRRGRRRTASIVAVFLLANSVLGAWLLTRLRPDPTPTAAASGQVEGDQRASAIARQVDPAVVDITTFAPVFGQSSQHMVPLGAGTGMILTATGEILTNNHVVDRAWRIEVSINGRPGTPTATVIGVDPGADVALIQLHGVSGLPTVTPAEAGSVIVGERVLGIGNALGRGGAPSVAVGSISGLDRTIQAGTPGGDAEKLSGMIATDAQIQPGDSGGPLVDSAGHVIGMITAGGSNKQGPITGFAIPVETALGIVERIRGGEDSAPPIFLGERGHMGIAVRPLDPATARRLHVTAGALIVGVSPAGPAAHAGILAPSVITSIGGKAVVSGDALGTVLHGFLAGDRVAVKWIDASGEHTRSVLLDAGPAI